MLLDLVRPVFLNRFTTCTHSTVVHSAVIKFFKVHKLFPEWNNDDVCSQSFSGKHVFTRT